MMISAVVLAKNEEKNIQACLKTLQWANEMVVIDDYSEDRTTAIAKKLGAKVYKHRLNNNFAAQRNFGLKKAKGEWVLFVDADERVSRSLQGEILDLTSSQNFAIAKKCDGFYLKRQDWFGGKWLKRGETANVKLLRLARKGAGHWKRKVHEIWDVKGQIGELTNPLLHYSHPTISQFLSQINFHSTLHAQALAEKGIKFNLLRLIVNPVGKFFQNYFFRLGLLDGMSGLIMALMMSLHSFLARAKLYELRKWD